MESFYIKRGHEYYVYILLCSDGSYYTGVTKDVDRRIEEHNEGITEDSYTFIRRPVALKYVEQFENIEKAIAREKQLKKWSRKKKEALINANYYNLKEFAKKKWNLSTPKVEKK
jgi:putative endonuclease